MTHEFPPPDFAHNIRAVGHSDQGGRPDGLQIMVAKGYAYVAHMFSGGFTVIDVRDPSRPRPVHYEAAPPNTWTIHLQQHDDLLLVVNARDMFASAEFREEREYYSGALGQKVGTAGGNARARDWSAGMAVYDLSRPAAPRRVGFLPVEGGGIHRIWYAGGRWAYVSALLDGFTDYILLTVDMADPERPVEAGRFWLPGMNLAAGEAPDWPPEQRRGLHHAIVAGDVAYAAWRDAGLVVVDVADRSAPKMIAHKCWAPPFAGGTHNALPLPDRDLLVVLDESVLDHRQDGRKPIWIFDNRRPSNPLSIATCPDPDEADYAAKPGHFGPHNLHENRPGSFVSSTLVFATYQNAGVRVFDISDPYRPREAGVFVPGPPRRLMDHRPGRPQVIQTADVFVDKEGLLYATDYNAGLYILEFQP